jgi:hypothetical protein
MGTGPWDYASNAGVLDKFWSDGIERNKNFESTITWACAATAICR